MAASSVGFCRSGNVCSIDGQLPVSVVRNTFADGSLFGLPRLDAPALGELGKFLHTGANFFSRQAQLIKFLKIKPKFGASAEPVAEPQRGVGRDRSLTVNDTSDSIHRDVDLPRHGGNSKFLQLFGKMLVGVYCGARHGLT
jgi:hypothetical protein